MRSGEAYKKNASSPLRHIAVLHYPPVGADGVPDIGVASILKKYGVAKCIYGHLHGPATGDSFSGTADGIEYALVSADHLGFKPCNLDCKSG